MNSFRSSQYRNIKLTSYHDGHHVYSAIQPVCKALLLDFKKERLKLESLPPFASNLINIPGEIDEHGEPLLFLPVYLISGWLLNMHANEVSEQKIELLQDLQSTIHRTLLSHWYGLLCSPLKHSNSGEYAIRSVVYDTPNNSVREIRAKSKSPVTLAISFLHDLHCIFTGTCDGDIPSL